MTDPSVPLPPPSMSSTAFPQEKPDLMLEAKVSRRLYFALPLLTLSWLIIAVVAVAAFLRIERWELAPGQALTVGPRIEFIDGEQEAPTRYQADIGMHFVTAFGGQLSALDAFVGWLDPDVQVDTYEERFGTQTPSARQVLNQQAMISSKQIAEYVAMKRLGFDAKLIPGPAVVGDVICEEDPDPLSACEVLDVGDTIISFNGSPTATLADLAEITSQLSPGDEVDVEVTPYQSENSEARRLKVIASPDDPSKTLVGIIPVDTRTVQLPFEVGISTADIGGPSAGLAFTLAILDELTAGNLMGEGTVVATGTMNDNEDVGAVGAVPQKAVAARDAGATLFLVPASLPAEEIEKARKAAGSSVKIVPVATLAEALAALVANGGDPLP